jgi:cellulose synthase/poly-beta-1,6-N-acetylglucosamine synthase-like glycosyltransferase
MLTVMHVMVIVFGISIIGVAYPFILYPVILVLLSAFRRPGSSGVDPSSELPSVSVIIPAHNEEIVMESKLTNMIECLDRIESSHEILVVSDGSTDHTCEIVRAFQPNVRLVETPSRSGILNALRVGFAASSNDVVFFSDADIQLQPDAIRLMLEHYRDKRVGGVCGSTRMRIQAGSGLEAERINVTYRRWVRLMQSRVFSTIGADGANWSIRRKLVEFPTRPVIAEDLVLPLSESVPKASSGLFRPISLEPETLAD